MPTAKPYIVFCSIIGMIIWIPIGFIFWIPVLIIAISTFCYEVVQASISNTQLNATATTRLNIKIRVYLKGFQHFEQVIKTALNNDSN